MFGPKRGDNGEWSRFHNQELHSLCRSPKIAIVINSRRLSWTGHVARMQEGRSVLKILTDKPIGESETFRNALDLDERTILE